MPVVELVGGSLVLSIEVLVGVILAQPLKATSRQKTARPGSHRVAARWKLHCLTGPAHLGMSTPAERPRHAEVVAGGQKLADAEVES